MRLNRIALVAGVLALGVAACGDDVEVVQPTPPPPQPPPPVEATMAPASASVAVGNSVVFAVNASGGVAGEAASWTCASSNTGIATVSSTSAGCSATGVAAGDVTITASVTKSGETVNVGAQLTVTSDEEPTQAGDPAFLVVASITGEDDTDSSGLQKRVTVTLNVERGDQTLEMLSLMVDGAVVESQSFGTGMGMTPPADEAAEQSTHAFSLAFDSHDYDRETGAPTYMNGEHAISAELQIAGGMMADGMMGHETISSNVVTVEFDNDDFIAASLGGIGDGVMNSNTGQIWYGGPDASVEISALPVLYSSGAVSSLTLLTFCGDDAATDSEAPFSFEVDCDGWTSGEDGDEPEFTVGGDDIDVRASAVYLDFDGPGAPIFRPNRNSRLDGWINGTLALTSTSGRNADSWLRKLSGSDAGGVEGYTTQLRFGGDLDEALAATPSSSPSLPAASTSNDAYCVIASAVDDLGNESALPDEDDGACEDTGRYDELLDALKTAEDAVPDGEDPTDAQQEGIDDAIDDLAEAGLLAGVDVEAPMVEFTTSASSPIRSAREFQVAASDAGRGRSGIHDVPVLARVTLRNAEETLCGSDIREEGEEDDSNTEMIPGDPDEDCENTSAELTVTDAGGAAKLATTDIFGTGDNEIGFYTFTAQARDKAGNVSDEIERVVLNDTEAPSVGITARVPAVGADGAFDVTVLMADDLSLRDVRGDGSYDDADDGADYTIRLVPQTSINPFNSPVLTQEHILQLADVETLLKLYETGTFDYADFDPTSADAVDEVALAAAATDYDLADVSVRLRDQSGASDTDDAAIGVDPSLTPFVYKLTTEVPDEVDADDPATTDVNEREQWEEARDEARDARAAEQAAKEIGNDGTNALFSITDFDGADPAAADFADSPDNVVSDNDVTIDLEVEVRGNAQGDADALPDFQNPFERVDFYVSDAAEGGTTLPTLHRFASAVGFSAEYTIDEGETENDPLIATSDDDDRRVWTYAVEVSGDVLEGIAKGIQRDGPFDRNIYAFGITSRGKAALVSAAVPVSIEER